MMAFEVSRMAPVISVDCSRQIFLDMSHGDMKITGVSIQTALNGKMASDIRGNHNPHELMISNSWHGKGQLSN